MRWLTLIFVVAIAVQTLRIVIVRQQPISSTETVAGFRIDVDTTAHKATVTEE